MDLEALYPDPSNPKLEMSLEELCALRRGWMDRDRVIQLRKQTAPEKKPRRQPLGDASMAATTTIDNSKDPVNTSLSTQLKDKLVVHNRTHSLGENDENDENAVPQQKVEKAKMRYREIRGETQTSKLTISDMYQQCTDEVVSSKNEFRLTFRGKA